MIKSHSNKNTLLRKLPTAATLAAIGALSLPAGEAQAATQERAKESRPLPTEVLAAKVLKRVQSGRLVWVYEGVVGRRQVVKTGGANGGLAPGGELNKTGGEPHQTGVYSEYISISNPITVDRRTGGRPKLEDLNTRKVVDISLNYQGKEIEAHGRVFDPRTMDRASYVPKGTDVMFPAIVSPVENLSATAVTQGKGGELNPHVDPAGNPQVIALETKSLK